MGRGPVPYLCCADAAAAIDFYTTTFGAVEVQRWTADDGRIGHAELTLAGGPLFLADEHPEIGVRGPRALGGTAVSFVLTVPDADETVARAVAAGATVERPVTLQDDGARAGWIVDPFGHRWNVQTEVQEMSVDQLRDRVGDRYDITDQEEPSSSGARVVPTVSRHRVGVVDDVADPFTDDEGRRRDQLGQVHRGQA